MNIPWDVTGWVTSGQGQISQPLDFLGPEGAWAQPCGCEAAWQEKQQQQEAGEGQCVPVALLGCLHSWAQLCWGNQSLVRHVLRQFRFEGDQLSALSWMPLWWGQALLALLLELCLPLPDKPGCFLKATLMLNRDMEELWRPQEFTNPCIAQSLMSFYRGILTFRLYKRFHEKLFLNFDLEI